VFKKKDDDTFWIGELRFYLFFLNEEKCVSCVMSLICWVAWTSVVCFVVSWFRDFSFACQSTIEAKFFLSQQCCVSS